MRACNGVGAREGVGAVGSSSNAARAAGVTAGAGTRLSWPGRRVCCQEDQVVVIGLQVASCVELASGAGIVGRPF